MPQKIKMIKPKLILIPIDFQDVAKKTGLRKGKLCKTVFGWGVQNVHGEIGPHFVRYDPPGEHKEIIRIVNGNMWELLEE